jgi:hypothetical protein
MPAPKPLSKEDILRAQRITKSNRAAARYLGCSYNHYKRYAQLYENEEGKTLFKIHLNPSGKGIHKFAVNNTGKKAYEALKSILDGGTEIDHFSPKEIKEALLREGYIEQKCNHCDFREERVIDRRLPLLMNFKDKNKRNYNIENLEMLCYNCYFLFIGDVFNEKQVINIEDYHGTIAVEGQVDWEIDEDYIENLRDLKLREDDESDGSQYISRI